MTANKRFFFEYASYVIVIVGIVLAFFMIGGAQQHVDLRFRQIEAVVNPVTNKIHLFGLGQDGKAYSYSASTGVWSDLDHSEAGYID